LRTSSVYVQCWRRGREEEREGETEQEERGGRGVREGRLVRVVSTEVVSRLLVDRCDWSCREQEQRGEVQVERRTGDDETPRPGPGRPRVPLAHDGPRPLATMSDATTGSESATSDGSVIARDESGS
jgi:hypothetical protein